MAARRTVIVDPTFAEDLRIILQADVLPAKLADRLALALSHYRSVKAHRQELDREHVAIERVVGLVRKLRTELSRGLRGPKPPISDLFAWQFGRLAGQIDDMFTNFEECGIDLDEKIIGPSGPRERRRVLRYAVMKELETAGISLNANASGRAAQVVALMLSEADRLDGLAPKTRHNLNGTEWGRWVAEYQARQARKPKESRMANVRIY